MVYRCECCDYEGKQRQDLLKHLATKKHITRATRINEENKDVLGDLKTQMKQCQEEISDLKKQNEILKEQNEYIMSILKDHTRLREFGSGTTNVMGNNSGTINNYHTHVHLSLNKYGTEAYPTDMKALTDAVKGVNKAIPNLVKLRHFDTRYPENQNIMIPNKKLNKIKIYDGTRWITEDKKLTIEDKLQEFTNFMDTDEGQEIYNGCSLMIRDKLDRLMNFCEKVHIGDKLNREEQRELKRITGDVENIILDHQKK